MVFVVFPSVLLLFVVVGCCLNISINRSKVLACQSRMVFLGTEFVVHTVNRHIKHQSIDICLSFFDFLFVFRCWVLVCCWFVVGLSCIVVCLLFVVDFCLFFASLVRFAVGCLLFVVCFYFTVCCLYNVDCHFIACCYLIVCCYLVVCCLLLFYCLLFVVVPAFRLKREWSKQWWWISWTISTSFSGCSWIYIWLTMFFARTAILTVLWRAWLWS